MRSRPKQEERKIEFINNAAADKQDRAGEIEASGDFVKWPLINFDKMPNLADGSNLKRPMNLPLKEYEWNTIEQHVKNLGVSKTEWIRHSIYKLLREEQDILGN